MASPNPSWRRTVFRLRGIPGNIQTFEQVAGLLSRGLGDVDVGDIRVCSLATTLNSWKVSTKVATVMLKSVPSLLATHASSSEWHIDVDFQDDPLILDTHFLGLTPLNDVETERHTTDCVAISGLASHPFGSWAAKGDDKRFMWIRDELPSAFPGMRTIIYGYNSDMDDLTSFQSIGDLARGMIDRLGASRWKSPTSPKIIFLAHSLGGILLKEALVQISKSREAVDKNLLDRIIGAILLGVPNLGMEQGHFLSIVERQPNECLVETLSRDSDFLRKLDDQFSAIISDKNLKVFWGYETRASPIARNKTPEVGKPAEAKAAAVLVSQHSATSRMILKCPERTFAINETHSELVKFSLDSHYLDVIISKLRAITISVEAEPVPPAILAEKRQRPAIVSHRRHLPPTLSRRFSNKQGDILRKIIQKNKTMTKQTPAWRKRQHWRIPRPCFV